MRNTNVLIANCKNMQKFKLQFAILANLTNVYYLMRFAIILLVLIMLTSGCNFFQTIEELPALHGEEIEPILISASKPIEHPPAITGRAGTVSIKSIRVLSDEEPLQVSSPSTYRVTITSEFEPKIITIHSGDSVIWTNKDFKTHSATSSDFDTGIIAKNEEKIITFDTSGTYNYNDSSEPSSIGTIVVE